MARVKEFFLPAFLFQLLGLCLMIYFAEFTEAGVIGVTASLTAITVASQVFYYWPLCLRLTGVDFKTFVHDLLVPGFLPTLAGAVVWVGLRLVTPPDSWFTLILCGAIGSLAYLGVLLAFCLNASERADARSILARLTARKSQKEAS